jgi:hypothetical protein
VTFKLSRRSALKGVGGAVVALPWLEAMLDGGPALAQTANPPKRYVVCFGGQSLGADNDRLHNDYVPNTVGPNYDLKSALAPLANHNNVKNEVSVVSGLSIPVANGGSIPAGGRPDNFHVSSLSPLLSGVRSSTDYATSRGPTSDQLVANAIAGSTTFKSLVYRIQADWYLSVAAPFGRDMMSYKTDPAGNPLAIPPAISPQLAFNALFGNFTPPQNPAAAARQQFQLRSRRSVLDLVQASSATLLPKLGAADRVRMERHYDEIRDLENRISALPPAATGICQQPANPGADPPIGGAQGTDPSGQPTYSQNLGYSEEEQRARVFCDLVQMALACDLTRVVSLQFTMFQSHMNMYPLTGQPFDLHELGHSGAGTLGVSRAIAWHIKHFAYLVAKLRDTPEAGGSMLNNTALVFLHEGGHGRDSSSGTQFSSHSTENMACLIAGRVGGLNPGRHVVANGMHPANVLLTAMRAVGYPGNSLGEVSGDLPALRG